MQRRHFLAALAPLLAAPLAVPAVRARLRPSPDGPMISDLAPGADVAQPIVPLDKPHGAWKSVLTPDEYDVLFEEHTERAGSSALDAEKRAGTYVCAACHLPLFASTTKFDSGTGWPSFYAPLPGRVATKRDFRLILPRTEYHCVRCGGHQGHRFGDGPKPTGQRYCNNCLLYTSPSPRDS